MLLDQTSHKTEACSETYVIRPPCAPVKLLDKQGVLLSVVCGVCQVGGRNKKPHLSLEEKPTYRPRKVWLLLSE